MLDIQATLEREPLLKRDGLKEAVAMWSTVQMTLA